MADGLYDQFMVIGLRQPGHADRANHPGTLENVRETAAVRSIFTLGQQELLFDAFALALQQLAQVERAVSKAIDQPDLALDPFVIVCTGARPAGVEKLLFAAPDIDGDGEFVLNGILHQPAADLPGGILIKSGKLQLLLFN